ncbi:MAG: hypothetical protein HUK40_03295 [Desulfobacter sp.]|nr:hypothetical protein [Desulfobacter sp.]WDP85193.1 MAG: hypothetical protein HUN05_08640 [Desulfobacter sp.]
MWIKFLNICFLFLPVYFLVILPCPQLSAQEANPAGTIKTNLYASALISPDKILMVGSAGKIFLSHDAGSHWTTIDSGT